MKARTLGALALASVAAAAAVVVRRRRRAVIGVPVQIGLADGSTLTLERRDPGVAELRELAAGVRRGLEAGG